MTKNVISRRKLMKHCTEAMYDKKIVTLDSGIRDMDEKLDDIIEMLDFIRINYLMSDEEVTKALGKFDT